MYMRLRRVPMQPSRWHHALATGDSKVVDRTRTQMCEPTQSRRHIARTVFCLANATTLLPSFFCNLRAIFICTILSRFSSCRRRFLVARVVPCCRLHVAFCCCAFQHSPNPPSTLSSPPSEQEEERGTSSSPYGGTAKGLDLSD